MNMIIIFRPFVLTSVFHRVLIGLSVPLCHSVAPEIHMLKQFKGDAIIVKKGEPIEIPADVLGLPIPKIEWSKDDVVMEQPTETLLMETEVTGRMNCKTKLSIPAANRKDRGSYTVSASNNMGSAKHTIYVMVLGELRRAAAVCVVCVLQIKYTLY